MSHLNRPFHGDSALEFTTPLPDSAPQSAAEEQAIATARCAVGEYLRDLGLSDPEVIAAESREIVARSAEELRARGPLREPVLVEASIRLTVQHLERWLKLLAADDSEPAADAAAPRLGSVLGAKLPGLLRRYPRALNGHAPSREDLTALRSDLTPVVPAPRPREMRPQKLRLLPARLRNFLRSRFGLETGAPEANEKSGREKPRVLSRFTPIRAALAGLTLLSTTIATWMFFRSLAADGVNSIELLLTALFTVLFVWVAFSFWTATFGLVVLLRRRNVAKAEPVEPAALPRTAILMPVYNEDTASVFAGVRAITEDLRRRGASQIFDFFVLSDTTNPDIWLEEERAWARLVTDRPGGVRVFYRHRPQNVSRKAGNIADFCSRWGEHYKYMIVLDADSLMAAETLLEMVQRMEADEAIGILQAPPTPVSRQSLFARMQQFASRVYGPVFLEGFALWSQCDGNYWGHNAILRVQPFMEHCDLPILPGNGPLGGEILSHDFVEAALMRRAGWKVCLAHDLEGSYEECPTTVLDFAQRDQRWCQGNMQHIRLLLAEGLHPASRLHLGMGAMSYLASPLWLMFLVLTILAAMLGGGPWPAEGYAPGGGTLFAATMGMLLLPKLWGVIALTRRPGGAAERKAYEWSLGGAILETLASILLAPIMMLLHSRFVVSTLLGRKVQWNAQRREDSGVSFSEACAVHWPHTLIGLVVGTFVWLAAPAVFPWLTPVLLGLVFSIPLAMLMGSSAAGRALAEAGLLLIPEEVEQPELLRNREEAREAAGGTGRADAPFLMLLEDPAFFAMHRGILRATAGEVRLPREDYLQAARLLAQNEAEEVSPELRRAVLNDPEALEDLHILVRSHLHRPRSALLT